MNTAVLPSRLTGGLKDSALMKRPAKGGVPARKRGRYDRVLTRCARQGRQVAQRERMLAALAARPESALAISVARDWAGRNWRNTFDEFFDDVEQAVQAVCSRAVRDWKHGCGRPWSELARPQISRVR